MPCQANWFVGLKPVSAPAWAKRLQMLGQLAALVFGALVLVACAEKPVLPSADLVLLDGKVITVDATLGLQQAIAVSGHTIVAVGRNEDIRGYIGERTQVLDLDGQTVIPGLIEGHGHFLGLGRAQQVLNLSSADSYAQVLARIGAAVDRAKPGDWIFGMGWHQDKWQDSPQPSVDGVPTNASLSALSPNNPVLLSHASGHAAFVNAAALNAADITKATKDPAGGTLVRTTNGDLTGLLRETAQVLVMQAVLGEQALLSPAERKANVLDQVDLAARAALSYGITSFHDAGSNFSTIDLFRELDANNQLPVRLYVMAKDTPENIEANLKEYFLPFTDNSFLTVRSIKQQIDGALGAHGAWLLEPYVDMPESSGLVLEAVADIEANASLALELGYQVNTHAIGTRANREVLDLYERVWAEQEASGSELRWRVEHAQHIDADDVPRFSSLGVIASVQGVHCTSDGPWIASRLGERRAEQTSYRWRDLLDSGARVSNGTDAPVESINPFASLAASHTRTMNNGEKFHPAQAMTREEALHSYTLGNAYAAFEEDVKGSITPGKLADLVVLDRDYLTMPADEMATLKALYTIVGGEIRYQAEH